MSSLADRIVAGLRMHERERPYQLERPVIQTLAEGTEWLLTYRSTAGLPVWPVDDHETCRMVAIKLLWLRHWFAEEWQQRGGRDAVE